MDGVLLDDIGTRPVAAVAFKQRVFLFSMGNSRQK